jgi:hypothetical protein
MRLRFDYPTVVSTLALFVALSGTAYAAATITGADVVNGSLTGKDVKNGTLKSADVAGLTSADFAANGLPGARMEAAGGGLIVPDGPDSVFEMDTEGYDTGNMYTAPDDFITVRRSGTYLVSAYLVWGATTDGELQMRVVVNGQIVHLDDFRSATRESRTLNILLRLQAGDTVGLGTFTGSGPIAITDFNSQNDAWLSAQMISR